jgi:hypothetical protein
VSRARSADLSLLGLRSKASQKGLINYGMMLFAKQKKKDRYYKGGPDS